MPVPWSRQSSVRALQGAMTVHRAAFPVPFEGVAVAPMRPKPAMPRSKPFLLGPMTARVVRCPRRLCASNRRATMPRAWTNEERGCPLAGPTMVDLIHNGTMSVEMAATLWAAMDARRSLLVVAVPRLAGKSTVENAALALLPPRRSPTPHDRRCRAARPHESCGVGWVSRGP